MSEPTKFRKMPVEIEAMQWDGTVEGATAIIDWILAHDGTATYVGLGEEHPMRRSDDASSTADEPFNGVPFLIVSTLEGRMRADVGSYIIKGILREFYPCKPDIFVASYAEVDPGVIQIDVPVDHLVFTAPAEMTVAEFFMQVMPETLTE